MQFMRDTFSERPATRRRVREAADLYLKRFRAEAVLYQGDKYAGSKATPDLFTHYTGQTHNSLLTRWFGADRKEGGEGVNQDTQSRFTTCNAFAGKYAHWVVPGSKRKSAQFMGFYFEKECIKAGLELAYFSQALHPDRRPGYGDIVKFKRHHVAVSLGCSGPKWDRIEGGQGGRAKTAEHSRDTIAMRIGDPYSPAEIQGWVNLAILLDYDEHVAEQERTKQHWENSSSPWNSLMQANRNAHQQRVAAAQARSAK